MREDDEEAARLVALYNQYLANDHVQLLPLDHIGRRSVYKWRWRDHPIVPVAAFDFGQYTRLTDPGVLEDHLRRIDASIDDDPAAAIGVSKELVESVCKVILADCGVVPPRAADLLDLYKLVATELRLNAEAVPNSVTGSAAAKRTLRTLVTTIQSLAELRNALGTGHGPRVRSPAQPRHGRLAFHATVTVSEFLLATWHERTG